MKEIELERRNRFQQRVREQYLKLHENEPERVILINGEQSIEDVRTEIWNHVKKNLNYEII